MKNPLRPLILGLITMAPSCRLPSRSRSRRMLSIHQGHCVVPAGIAGRRDRADSRAKTAEAGGRFYVENLPGAGGMIGTAAAAKASPDGCTMVIVNQNFVVQPAIGEKLAYEVPGSFAPVTLLLAAPETIAVNPSVPATTMKELVRAGEGNSRQVQLRVARLWFVAPSGKRAALQAYARARPRACPIPGRASGRYLDSRRSHPDAASHPSDRRSAGARRQTSDAGNRRQTRAAEFPDVPTLEQAGIPNHEVGFWNGIWFPGERRTTSLNSGIGKSARSWRCPK